MAKQLAERARDSMGGPQAPDAETVRTETTNARPYENDSAARMASALMRGILTGTPAYRQALAARPAPPHDLQSLICRLTDAMRSEEFLAGGAETQWDGMYAAAFAAEPGGGRTVALAGEQEPFPAERITELRKWGIRHAAARTAVASAPRVIDHEALWTTTGGDRNAVNDMLAAPSTHEVQVDLEHRPGERERRWRYGRYRVRFTITLGSDGARREGPAELVRIERSNNPEEIETGWKRIKTSAKTQELIEWLADAMTDPGRPATAAR